jgi:hypothetical protein
MNTEEETILDDEQVEDEIVEEVEETEDVEQEDEESPYRSKLNATNRFLEKEGYKFEKGKGWVKPTETTKPVTKKSVDSGLNSSDTLAFIDAQVTNSEDIAEVMKLAKGFGISLSEALKDKTVKHRLEVLRDERKTAEASNTRTARSGAKGIDAKQLVENLAKGDVPKTGSNEAEELYWARRGGRRK